MLYCMNVKRDKNTTTIPPSCLKPHQHLYACFLAIMIIAPLLNSRDCGDSLATAITTTVNLALGVNVICPMLA